MGLFGLFRRGQSSRIEAPDELRGWVIRAPAGALAATVAVGVSRAFGLGWDLAGPGVIHIVLGAGLYLWCLRLFATVGGGTPGPWDAPLRVDAVGPNRWVRNPIYLAAVTVVLGEAWLFGSTALLQYVAVMAVTVHLFVVGYEEPTLRRRLGTSYTGYTDRVRRWVPRRPQHG